MSGLDGGLESRLACKLLFAGKRHQQDGIRRRDADRHDRSHQRRHVQRRAGDEQHGENAAQRRRQRQDDDERVAEILVVHDHQQVDEHRRKQQSDAEIDERAVHALDLADHLDGVSRFELLLQIRHDAADLVGDTAEIAVLHARIDLIDRLNIGLIGVGRYAAAPEGRHVAEQARHRDVGQGCGYPGRDRRVAEIVERADLVLGRLHREIIRNSRFGIGPEIGRHLLRRAQADIDVGGDGVRVEPELGGTRAIDIGIERRCIDFLLQMRIRDPRYRRDPPAQLFGNAQIVVLVVADRADVDLRRQAEIEDLGDDVGRLEIERALQEMRPAMLPSACAHIRWSAGGLPSATPG